jgi:hypothetical protein
MKLFAGRVPMDKLCPKALVGIATMPAKIALITKKARPSKITGPNLLAPSSA